MKISEFVKGRDIEKQAVYRYLSRHGELMEKCKKDGKELELPPDVVAELEKQYPLAKPVVIVNGLSQEEERELREHLQKSQELLISIQNELTNTKLQLAEKEKTELLLEVKEEKIEQLTREKEQLGREVEKLREQREQDRKRGLWARILNR
jgi:predicted RNase H-like nuclease (RuvC/YqgF family)